MLNSINVHIIIFLRWYVTTHPQVCIRDRTDSMLSRSFYTLRSGLWGEAHSMWSLWVQQQVLTVITPLTARAETLHSLLALIRGDNEPAQRFIQQDHHKRVVLFFAVGATIIGTLWKWLWTQCKLRHVSHLTCTMYRNPPAVIHDN